MNLRFVWHDSLDDGDFPLAAYEDLLARLPQATPFNHPAWLRAAAMALAPGRELRVLVAFRAERMALCLPLVRCREKLLGLPMTVVRHLGHPLADRVALAVAPGEDEALAAALPRIGAEMPHALLQFDEVPAADDRLEVWGSHYFRHERRMSCRVPAHRIDDADRDEPPPGDARYELRRARRHCDALGAVTRRARPTADDIDDWCARLAAVDRASWKGEAGVGLFSAAYESWTRAALRNLAAVDRVRVVLLEHEGCCLSYRLGLLEAGRLYDYAAAYLPEHRALGSGRLLLDEWIRWGLDEGWQWVDAARVSRENSRHPLHERASATIEHHRWRFFARRPDGIALALAYRVWLRVKPLLRRPRQRKRGEIAADGN
ncbi:MAG: GNAT family N-acetyltransferase [Azoarcus sp.]|nr:GNAT family N-acetyltransferase [Azoarcus sp.]